MIEALRFCWAVQGTPCCRLLAEALPELVPRLRPFMDPVGDKTNANGIHAIVLAVAPNDRMAPRLSDSVEECHS
jgi:hypothetical protein